MTVRPGYNRSKGPSRGRPLHEVRHERGLSLRDLEQASGVNRAVLSQIERGRLIANAHELDRISATLGVRFELRTIPVTVEAQP